MKKTIARIGLIAIVLSLVLTAALIYGVRANLLSGLAVPTPVIDVWIRIFPQSAAGYYARGVQANLRGDLHAALVDFGRAVELNPNDARLRERIGVSLNDAGQHSMAIEMYDVSLQMKPDAETYLNRGFAFVKSGNLEQGIADYTKAIELLRADTDPGSVKGLHGFVYTNRGVAHLLSKMFAEALADFDRALTLNPDDAAAYDNRGRTYLEMRQFDKALSDFNKAISFRPKSGDLYFFRASTYRGMRRFDESLADFRKSKELGYDFDPRFFELVSEEKAAAA